MQSYRASLVFFKSGRKREYYFRIDYDTEEIKRDFNELYRQMNGMPLREMAADV